MKFIQDLIDKTLGKLINKLNGWKSTVGILVMAGLTAAEHLQWLTPETCAAIYPYASGLFGIGIIHKVVKDG